MIFYLPKLMLLVLPFYSKIKFVYISIVGLFAIIFLFKKKVNISKELFFLFLVISYGFLYSLISFDANVIKSAISWVLLFFMLVVLYQHNKNPYKLFKFIFIVMIIYSLDALFQFFNGVDIFGIPLCCGTRASGPFAWGSPVIGSFLMTLFFVPEFIKISNKIKILFYLLFFTAIILSGSRGALLQIVFVLFIFKFSFKYKIFSLVLIFVIFTFVLSSLSIDSHTFERLMLLFDPQAMWAYESRASGRIAFWDEYLMQIIQDNIILGAGLGGLEPYLFNLTGHYIHSHHLYLEIVLTFGMLGTILFIKFLFDLYTNTNKIEKMVFWSFWGPFNALHSVFDFYWATMMFFSLMIVLLSKQWRLQSEYKI